MKTLTSKSTQIQYIRCIMFSVGEGLLLRINITNLSLYSNVCFLKVLWYFETLWLPCMHLLLSVHFNSVHVSIWVEYLFTFTLEVYWLIVGLFILGVSKTCFFQVLNVMTGILKPFTAKLLVSKTSFLEVEAAIGKSKKCTLSHTDQILTYLIQALILHTLHSCPHSPIGWKAEFFAHMKQYVKL